MSRTQRILLVVLGVLLVLVLFNYFVYQPAQAEYATLVARQDALTAERTRLKAIAARREALEREFAQLQGSIPALEAKLPAEKEVPALLVQLEQLASSLKIELSSITIGAIQQGLAPTGAAPAPGAAPPAVANVGTVPLGLSIVATYHQLIELLSALHEFPRLIAVKSLSIGPAALPKLSVQLNAETYVLRTEAR